MSSLLSRFSMTERQQDIPLMCDPVYQKDRKLGVFHVLYAKGV